MRDEILDMCIEAVRRSGHPEATRESILREPGQARAVIALLRDCRPLPVIRELIEELESVAQAPARRPV